MRSIFALWLGITLMSQGKAYGDNKISSLKAKPIEICYDVNSDSIGDCEKACEKEPILQQPKCKRDCNLNGYAL